MQSEQIWFVQTLKKSVFHGDAVFQKQIAYSNYALVYLHVKNDHIPTQICLFVYLSSKVK